MEKIRIYLCLLFFPILISCGGGSTNSNTSPPVITLNGDNPISYHRLREIDETYVIPELELGAKAVDNDGNALNIDTINEVIYTRLGVYKTVYTATDDYGRSSSITRTVNIIDSLFDSGLTRCVNDELGIPFYIPPSKAQLNSVTTLNCFGGGSFDEDAIGSLSSISELPNLENLNLSNNVVSDINPLSSLHNLKSLDLSSNDNIQDFSSLGNLTNLESLILEHTSIVNNIEVLSVLDNLEILNLADTGLKDINLENLSALENLKKLILYNNIIHDVSALSNLPDLTYLDITFNCISDFSNLLFGLITLVGEDAQYPESDFCINN